MNYLLDTCVISELVKHTPNENVITWLNEHADETLFLSVVTIGEIRKGLTKLPESKKKQMLTHWLLALTENYRSRIYSVNLDVAENWGIIQGQAEKCGTPLSSIDSLIAATAQTYNLVVVTRNEKDFVSSNVPILNPWKSNPHA
ncbi:type II toxin-antitoxin system VapC family toxin [Pasteurella atlantica]|uniref:Type II toxin-antitoxin system VapC family toxin n=2 Tax=Pasteurellaceae TaxID=712 RepID=A0ACC6HQ24_9PAST|nr:type II toxin-antitoxin system VapC family toxin [Pasteurella atlantica]MDP8034559.1 type II toxin-antitoxin system VapC family toxin [Pasteurella atlantica]MDP8036505.1 type II toxin-antitoxin system VapC family toxin [Pasteurella atlantica]MDP8038445.1 type II toxin-antitoxin system VapC family toxin [Pasteurella atlantica]MDP8048830.1 type II toxin-antitoxin system VapC family toxin [Pasteurella atlantica]MDP8050045.1 type II toxin-antitoxin system VapC family toxin [Pasteurella atlantic